MGVRIFWAIIVGFLAGVLARSLFPINIIFTASAALLSILSLPIALIDRRFAKYAITAAFVFVAFGAGIFRADFGQLQADPLLQTRLDTRVTLSGVVSDEPDVRETSILVPIIVDGLISGSSSLLVHAKILAQFPPYTKISYGDVVRVSGTLRTPKPFDTGLGRQFDYPKYLAVSGILYQLANAHAQISGVNQANFIKTAAIDIKHIYVAGLAASLPEPESGLAGGITVGDKRSLGPDLSDAFRRVSLVHIIVLSGYNITVVIAAIGRVFSWLPQIFNFGISGLVVLFFILMTGGAASATRAGAMALLAMFARLTGRTFLALRALGAVSFLMVLWNPYTLAYDPSFQLSVLATLGLMLFTPIVALYLWWITEKFGLREIAAATLGTQCAVLPLLLYQNGMLSLVALPANLLALIPIPLAMLLSFIAAIAGMALGPLAVIVGFPAYVLLSYIIGVANVLGALPFAAIALPAFSALWMIAAYVVMFGGVMYLNNKKTAERNAQPLPRPDQRK